ncbi:LRV FeS4 cluster domain-containing protein [Bradyrhizobium sp. BRP22]|uniref:4Fe4S-binding leucine-rich repeat protein n=1 Tax=Bradyrhizobium sp. BRP22 TaxID=2793821 RepID=UPI001CD27862|nr:4Fe4S-binding leucine-rich repeat protein [Bradyrhizobium sp. BRP22]MCA1458196.1 LRV FeS4 cluster domain-containing protein [Bradyrhizobium sp. BRP22]
MTIDIDKARDWLRDEVDCETCAHIGLRASGDCRLLHACVHDRYARRIDRFFNWNPALADAYITHPHFEVRAIAANHASVFLLPMLLDDAEETVRWNAARRLPKRFVLRLRNDPHREVRMRVATLLDGEELAPMISDQDCYVRLVLASRIAPALLGLLMSDDEPEVRRVVAIRVPNEWLLGMVNDPNGAVRLEVARRLCADSLSMLRRDPDWRVRYEVASRVTAAGLAELTKDEDQMVQEVPPCAWPPGPNDRETVWHEQHHSRQRGGRVDWAAFLQLRRKGASQPYHPQ